MGRLGATQLAAATLALNLTFTLNVLLLGLLIASSPMMATALGQRFNAVRDVRRTFRAALDPAHLPCAVLAAAVACRLADARSSARRQSLRVRADVPPRLHVVHGALASVPAPAELRVGTRAAAGGVMAQPRRHRAQCSTELGIDFWPFRTAGAGPCRRRRREHAHLAHPVRRFDRRRPARPAVPPLPFVRPLVAVRRPEDTGDGQARLADRRDHGAGNGRLRACRLFHGLDRRTGCRGACDRAAIGCTDVHGAAGARAGGHGPCRPGTRPQGRGGNHARRLDVIGHRRRFHGGDGAGHVEHSRIGS